jgi:uncharacterized protein (DUF1684 family)
MRPKYRLIMLSSVLLAACGGANTEFDRAGYEAEIEEWREQRLASLKSPHGYLNLAGLFWLADESTSFGSDAANDIVFPHDSASRIGEFEVTEAGVFMQTEPGVDVRYEEIPVRSILISDDTTKNPVTIAHRSLAWTAIKRDGRFAVRLRDFEHPAIAAFPPIEHFPIAPELIVTAKLKRFDEPKILNVETVIEGLGYRPQSPGIVEFEIGGEIYSLEAYASGDELFFVFGDRTSGRGTYPAGRFLYAKWPGDDGVTQLDFNRAYNPPCAFNSFATCPVASPRNRLATKIEAGEKFDPETHSTPDSAH